MDPGCAPMETKLDQLLQWRLEKLEQHLAMTTSDIRLNLDPKSTNLLLSDLEKSYADPFRATLTEAFKENVLELASELGVCTSEKAAPAPQGDYLMCGLEDAALVEHLNRMAVEALGCGSFRDLKSLQAAINEAQKLVEDLVHEIAQAEQDLSHERTAMFAWLCERRRDTEQPPIQKAEEAARLLLEGANKQAADETESIANLTPLSHATLEANLQESSYASERLRRRQLDQALQHIDTALQSREVDLSEATTHGASLEKLLQVVDVVRHQQYDEQASRSAPQSTCQDAPDFAALKEDIEMLQGTGTLLSVTDRSPTRENHISTADQDRCGAVSAVSPAPFLQVQARHQLYRGRALKTAPALGAQELGLL